ncbi:beta-ketoacyl synthase N-terminal-like domain-containing protein [Nocardia sp. NPDC046473]|uniref:beta-ketoacyl synthase N-terminal-like domain-containing protein n=1 Tax=Nocardia sp. NPDC046473 TaxID=3155733 RepID=UPI0033FD6786
MNRDMVVTGIGVVSPIGTRLEEFWQASLAGVCGIRPVESFDTDRYPVTLAGTVPPFEAEAGIRKRLLPQTDRMTRLALLASTSALEDADVDPAARPPYSMGVAVSTSTGGLEFGQRELQKLWGTSWDAVSPYMSFAWYYAVNTGQISIKNGMRGPCGVVVSEQAAGLDTLAFSRRRIRKGTALMTVGGVDGLVCPYGMSVVSAAHGVSTSGDCAAAFQPFSATSPGFIPGEGGAIFVVESRSDATVRSTAIYGTVAGYGSAFDPAPAATGDGLFRAAQQALADAGVAPDEVDVVFADGAGVPALDQAEAAVITKLFGERRVAVSVPKTMTGRLLAGGAALDVAWALLSMRDDIIPPAVNIDEDQLDSSLELVIGAPRHQRVTNALVLARGHGGFASAVLLTKPS